VFGFSVAHAFTVRAGGGVTVEVIKPDLNLAPFGTGNPETI